MSMATAMASEADGAGEAVRQQADEVVSLPQELEERLATLSERISLCSAVLEDLKALSGVMARKTVQDVSSSPKK